MNEFLLRVGQTATIRPRWWGTTWTMTYAGTIGETTYSVAVSRAIGHSAMAYNLYLRRGQQQFELPVGTVIVIEQSDEALRFRFDAAPLA